MNHAGGRAAAEHHACTLPSCWGMLQCTHRLHVADVEGGLLAAVDVLAAVGNTQGSSSRGGGQKGGAREHAMPACQGSTGCQRAAARNRSAAQRDEHLLPRAGPHLYTPSGAMNSCLSVA